MGKLRKVGIDPLAYVSFYGLRTHSELNNQPVKRFHYQLNTVFNFVKLDCLAVRLRN